MHLRTRQRYLASELTNAFSMVPGYILSASWDVSERSKMCRLIPTAYIMVCACSMSYHLTNYVIGYSHAMYVCDILAQLVCCICISLNHYAGIYGASLITTLALVLIGFHKASTSNEVLACRAFGISSSAIAIYITSGPYMNSCITWSLAFAAYAVSMLEEQDSVVSQSFHAMFHILGHLAVHQTVMNSYCV